MIRTYQTKQYLIYSYLMKKSEFCRKMDEDEKFSEYITQKITNRVSKWIGEQYPDIGEKLLKKAQELKEQELNLIRVSKEYYDKMNKNLKDHLLLVRTEVNEFMDKDHPNLVAGLTNVKNELDAMIKGFKDKEEWFDKKTKKIYDSQALYADVYQMKDELKSLQKEITGLTKKITDNPTLCEDVFRMRDAQTQIKIDLDGLTKKLKNLFK